MEAASAILKEGTIVGTKLDVCTAWYRNIIYRCEEDTVLVALLDKYLENLIIPGVRFQIRYFNEYFVYLFDGEVTGIQAQHPAYIQVRITKAEELINSRLSPRYDTYLSVRLKSVWDDTPYFAVATNLSFGGMAFTSTQRFDYGDELELSISFPDNKQINAKGKVIRRALKGNSIDYSMQFVEIDEYNTSLLSRHFSSLEDEMLAMQQKFFNEIRDLL